MTGPPYYDAASIAARLPPAAAGGALEAALRAGLDPEADAPRSSVAGAAGELLLMPSAAGGGLGVKLATVAPGNAERGLPRIQGVYVLFDGATLAPVALLDGIGLTNVRTSAVSALAVRHLAAPGAKRLVVFGTGPQARAHVAALRTVAPLEHVAVVGRDAERTAAFAREVAAASTDAEPLDPEPLAPGPPDPGPPDAEPLDPEPLDLGSLAAGPLAADATGPEAVADADLVCCCTTAREPLFDGDAVADHATVVAIGSHEPDAREVDERLVARATVVVESRASALREAGDVIAAVEAGAIRPGELLGLAALVRGEATVAPGRPRLFKSTGMAWEDLVLAAAVAGI